MGLHIKRTAKLRQTSIASGENFWYESKIGQRSRGKYAVRVIGKVWTVRNERIKWRQLLHHNIPFCESW